MANKKKSKKSKPGKDAALKLAALRWYAITIEQLGIEVFATSPEKFDDLAALLKSQVTALKKFGSSPARGGRPVKDDDEDDCPDGYELCRDGLCAPMCNGI